MSYIYVQLPNKKNNNTVLIKTNYVFCGFEKSPNGPWGAPVKLSIIMARNNINFHNCIFTYICYVVHTFIHVIITISEQNSKNKFEFFHHIVCMYVCVYVNYVYVYI